MASFIKGFLIGLSLICAIGVQNVFVIKQGLLRNNIFWVSLTCFLCDVLLISAGILGIGTIINNNIYILIALAGTGALFLIFYGALAFYSAYKGTSRLIIDAKETKVKSISATISITLAITLLNPHVYLDTVVIFGGITSSLHSEDKITFMIGAWLASAIWFFTIGYGAQKLSPFFSSPKVWQVLNTFIGLLMWFIASSLIFFIYQKFNLSI